MFLCVSTVENLVGGWEFAPIPTIGLALLAFAYVGATVRVDHRNPLQRWPRVYTIYFVAGVCTLGIALLGPPGFYDDTFFFAHMTQHILITALAAPLLALGEPVLLSLRAVPRSFRTQRLVPLYRSKAVNALTHPAVGWLVFVTVMVVSHVPAVYDYALRHPIVHDFVEHPVYLGSALLFFYPLLAKSPGRRTIPHGLRVLSLFTMMIPMAIIGFFIYATPRLGYPFYAHVARPFGPGPLQDQQLSGALMWSSSMVMGVIWLCLAGLRWLQAEERRSHQVDRAVARSLQTQQPPPTGLST